MIDEDLLAAAKPFFVAPFDGVIRIEVTDGDFAFWVDGRTEPPTVGRESPSEVSTRFCLWRIDYLDLNQLFSDGPRRIESSFIASRLKISGDMAVMARLEPAHG